MPDDPAIVAYLDHLRATGRASTAGSNVLVLETYQRLLLLHRSDATPTTATAADLMAYREALATPTASLVGRQLALTTQATHLATVRSFYHWLRRRGLSLLDPDPYLPLPRISRRTVQKDYLSTQEAQALLDTGAALVGQAAAGSWERALALRDLAAVALALATGRRRSGLCDLRLTDVDAVRRELRVEREKGRAGRVLPVASWAIALVVAYVREARPVLLAGTESSALLIGSSAQPLSPTAFDHRLDALVAATRAAHPDLVEFAGKRISSHSLRVTTARLLFANGCPIRSVNEILLHQKLSTTAAYTPIPIEEMRRVLLEAHPRA